LSNKDTGAVLECFFIEDCNRGGYIIVLFIRAFDIDLDMIAEEKLIVIVPCGMASIALPCLYGENAIHIR
jgi:hypothetical protein